MGLRLVLLGFSLEIIIEQDFFSYPSFANILKFNIPK